jgi:hypothetical protein
VGSGNRIVTVIEFLSPTNKVRGPGQDEYLKKQSELRQGGVNLVEIDLVRSGDARFGVAPHPIPAHLKARTR